MCYGMAGIKISCLLSYFWLFPLFCPLLRVNYSSYHGVHVGSDCVFDAELVLDGGSFIVCDPHSFCAKGRDWESLPSAQQEACQC